MSVLSLLPWAGLEFQDFAINHIPLNEQVAMRLRGERRKGGIGRKLEGCSPNFYTGRNIFQISILFFQTVLSSKQGKKSRHGGKWEELNYVNMPNNQPRCSGKECSLYGKELLKNTFYKKWRNRKHSRWKSRDKKHQQAKIWPHRARVWECSVWWILASLIQPKAVSLLHSGGWGIQWQLWLQVKRACLCGRRKGYPSESSG